MGDIQKFEPPGQGLKKLLEFSKSLANFLEVTLQSSPVSVCALVSGRCFMGAHYSPAELGLLFKQIPRGREPPSYSACPSQSIRLTSDGTTASTAVGRASHFYVKTYIKTLRYSNRLTSSKKSLIPTRAALVRIILFPTYHLLFIKAAIIKQFSCLRTPFT